MKKQMLVLVVMVVGLFAGFGCGSDEGDDGGGGGGGATVLESVSAQMTAAEGGAIAARGASLSVPAGALSEDTTITLEVRTKQGSPEADRIRAEVFEFGPSGLQFNQPATLEIPADTSGLTAGQSLAIAVLDDGAWSALGDSTVVGDKVVATTTHFSTFTVVVTGGGQTGGACDGGFDACGGDITGTWAFGGACMSFKNPTPPMEGCPESTLEMGVAINGTVTFGADGAYQVSGSSSFVSTFRAPKSCLPSGASCQDLDPRVTDEGDHCQLIEESTDALDDSGTWSQADGVLTMLDADGEASTVSYCVNGDAATVVDEDAERITSYDLVRQ